ncbi:hypothetical protein WJX74_000322 [Apatococcus lobatus]|uniref:Transmembrane protein n=1 Tax=Apatococcus lobatus TaxID=904363 RepID=A0AAW1RBD9_9CHLO
MELPFASGRLSLQDYESRRDFCTDHSVQSLASDPVFLRWLDSKRQELQTRKQQARARKRTSLVSLVTFVLVVVSGTFVYYRYGPSSFQLPAIQHLSRTSLPSTGSFHPARHLRTVSEYAQPLLDKAKPGPYLAAANSRLVPVYQQAASLLSAGIIQLPSLVPHAARHDAHGGPAHAPIQPPQHEPKPASMPPQNPAVRSATTGMAHGPESAGASRSEAAATKRPTLLQRMGRLSPVKTIARMQGLTAKGLANMSKQALLALPSSQSSPKSTGKVPISVITEPSDTNHQDAADKALVLSRDIMEEAPGLLQRVNRSSTSLAVYIARMPMRTAKTWGQITKQTLLALPAANYLSLYKPSEPAEERSPADSAAAAINDSDLLAARKQRDEAESAADTTLLGRFNRSSKPLANLVSRLPARTSQGLIAFRRQPLLALPAAEPSTSAIAQDDAGAAHPALSAGSPSSQKQATNDTACATTGSAAVQQTEAGDGIRQSAAASDDSCTADTTHAAVQSVLFIANLSATQVILIAGILGAALVLYPLNIYEIFREPDISNRGTKAQPLTQAASRPRRKTETTHPTARKRFCTASQPTKHVAELSGAAPLGSRHAAPSGSDAALKLAAFDPITAARPKPEASACQTTPATSASSAGRAPLKEKSTLGHAAFKLTSVSPVPMTTSELGPIARITGPEQQLASQVRDPPQVLDAPISILNGQSADTQRPRSAALQPKAAPEDPEQGIRAMYTCGLSAQHDPMSHEKLLGDDEENSDSPASCISDKGVPVIKDEPNHNAQFNESEARVISGALQPQPEAVQTSEAGSEYSEECSEESIALLPSESDPSDAGSDSDASELDGFVVVEA